VSHPSLGLPPRSQTSAFPEGAARLHAQRAALAARSLEIAANADPTLAKRHDEAALRNLLADAELYVDQLALCVGGNDPSWLRELAKATATVYRRRRVPLDDVIHLFEGMRGAVRGILSDAEMVAANTAIDEAIEGYAWYRRLAGDARKRNPILAAIYKGG
jgi:hypothetical protein